MGIDDAFDAFQKTVNEDIDKTRLARERRDLFKTALLSEPDVVETFGSGSLSRSTQLKPIHDVDVVIVYDPDEHPEWGNDGPERPGRSRARPHPGQPAAEPDQRHPRQRGPAHSRAQSRSQVLPGRPRGPGGLHRRRHGRPAPGGRLAAHPRKAEHPVGAGQPGIPHRPSRRSPAGLAALPASGQGPQTVAAHRPGPGRHQVSRHGGRHRRWSWVHRCLGRPKQHPSVTDNAVGCGNMRRSPIDPYPPGRARASLAEPCCQRTTPHRFFPWDRRNRMGFARAGSPQRSGAISTGGT